MKNNNRLWKIGKDGQLIFDTCDEVTKRRSKPEIFWNHPIFLVIIISSCLLVDFFNFKQLFDSFLFDGPYARATGIIAFLIAYDAIPIWLGINLKKMDLGYRVNKIMIKIMIAVFILAFFANISMRIVTRDLVLPLTSDIFSGTINGDVNSINQGQTNEKLVIMYAIFGSIIPLITSLASGTISYAISNPLHNEKIALEKQNNLLNKKIEELNTVLEEYNNNEDYIKRLKFDDTKRYIANRDMISAHKGYLINYVHERIEEDQGNPTSTSILSKPSTKETF